MKTGFMWAALPVALSTTAMPAAAAQYLITYTGTVTTGVDVTGVFGAAGSDLSGRVFTAAYTLTFPLAGGYAYQSANGSYTFGGTIYGLPSPVWATFTLGGTSISIGGTYMGVARQLDNYGSYDEVAHIARDNLSTSQRFEYTSVNTSIDSQFNNIVSNANLTSPLSYAFQAGDNRYGAFEIRHYDVDPGSGIASNERYAFADLASTSVTIAPLAGAVPEPSAWALLILGFGVAGAAMRAGRRRKTVIAYA